MHEEEGEKKNIVKDENMLLCTDTIFFSTNSQVCSAVLVLFLFAFLSFASILRYIYLAEKLEVLVSLK